MVVKVSPLTRTAGGGVDGLGSRGGSAVGFARGVLSEGDELRSEPSSITPITQGQYN